MKELMDFNEVEHVLLTGGGIIPDEDIEKLKKIGTGEIFGPGTSIDEIIKYIKEWFDGNRKT